MSIWCNAFYHFFFNHVNSLERHWHLFWQIVIRTFTFSTSSRSERNCDWIDFKVAIDSDLSSLIFLNEWRYGPPLDALFSTLSAFRACKKSILWRTPNWDFNIERETRAKLGGIFTSSLCCSAIVAFLFASSLSICHAAQAARAWLIRSSHVANWARLEDNSSLSLCTCNMHAYMRPIKRFVFEIEYLRETF